MDLKMIQPGYISWF